MAPPHDMIEEALVRSPKLCMSRPDTDEDSIRKLLNGKTTRIALSPNSLQVLARRYLMRDPDTDEVIETPEEMFHRVAVAIAEVERRHGATGACAECCT